MPQAEQQHRYILASIDYYISYLMINLNRQGESRGKTKTMYTANKSHIVSMNLRISTDYSPECTQQELNRNKINRQRDDERHSKSGHKYKKSIILQENTIQLMKKSSANYTGRPTQIGMSTDRMRKEMPPKRSVDYRLSQIKTEMDEVKQRESKGADFVEINVDQLRDIVLKLRSLKAEKQNLSRQIALYRKELMKESSQNSVLKALTS